MSVVSRSPVSLLLAVAMLALPAASHAQITDLRAELFRIAATRFIDHLAASRFDSAAAMVSPAVPAGALGEERLRMAWGQITGQAGALRGIRPVSVSAVDTLRIVELDGRFDRTTLGLRVAFMPDGMVGGFFIVPAAHAELPPPPYADTVSYREEPVTIGEGRFQLQGTLTLPRNASRVPVVVLLHGSGPNDRDGRVGGAAPLRDLAWGLASRGIAVLRFDKRTYAHGAALAALPRGVTLEQEVLEDAVAALAVARAHPATDPARVYLLGHSLGGLVAPEVALRDRRLAGVILLAAPARTLTESVRDQFRHLAEHASSPEERRRIETAAAEFPGRHFSSQRTDTRFPALLAYFLEVDAFDQRARARRVDAPFLVLQGERDYQVTMQDFQLWREALANRRATFVSFPTLNHLFVSGSGVSLPAEYEAGGHVAEEVIDRIAGWIRR